MAPSPGPGRVALRAARTCLALRAHAGEGGHAVDAGGPRRAGGEGAVVDVLAAVVAAPAVDAHAAVAPVAVGARAPVLTGVGLQQALVHVLRAELAFGGGGGSAFDQGGCHAGPRAFRTLA